LALRQGACTYQAMLSTGSKMTWCGQSEVAYLLGYDDLKLARPKTLWKPSTRKFK
jgi:hypothetical protein